MRFFSLAGSFILLCALIPAASGQAASPEVVKLVKTLADKCEAAKEYSFEGELLLVGQRGSAPGRVLSKAKVKMAVGPQGKSLLRLEPADKDEYLLVSNGQKSWAFVPRLKQYTEEESALRDEGEPGEDEPAESDTERDPAESFARMVMPSLTMMYRTAEGAEINGSADVKYENKKQTWPVLRVISKQDKRDGRNLVELTLDPAALTIGRLVLANLSNSGGEKLLIRMTMDFNYFRIGDSIPDSTFHFDPPRNAKLVDAVPIPGQTGSFLLNRPAPDFELKTLEGEKIRLADLRGRPVLLNFWASWCPPCRRELPILVKLHEEFKGRLVVLGINDEGRGTARGYAEKAGLTFATLDDSGLKAHRLYRVRSIPTAFLIDGTGKIVRFFSGARDESTLRSALRSAGL